MKLRAGMVFLALTSFGPGLPADAQPVRWIVVETAGITEPTVDAPQEVEPGTSIKLARGSSLMFSDYTYNCRTLTIADGVVAFSKAGWDVASGGTIAAEHRYCPRRYTLRDQRRPMTLMSPSRGRPEISRRPLFLFTGALADTVVLAQLDSEISTIPLRVQSRRAELMDDGATLAASSTFRLSVRLSNPGVDFQPLIFHVHDSPLSHPVDRVTLIELDEYRPGLVLLD